MTLVNDSLTMLDRAGVAEPARLLAPLLSAALDNVLRLGDAALTGPVVRGDVATVSAHVDVAGPRGAADPARRTARWPGAPPNVPSRPGSCRRRRRDAIMAALS